MADKVEYNSIHDGPAIDAAVTRASEGGSIDAAIQAKPNPNLLDNWYFGNPVNQRGQTGYNGAGYTIDRWKMYTWHATNPAVTVEDGCIVLSDGTAADTSNSTYLIQYFEAPERFAGKTVTLSIKLRNFKYEGGEVYAFIYANGSLARRAKLYLSSANTVTAVTTTLPATLTALSVSFGQDGSQGGKGSFEMEIEAVKLELGATQTLAHQDTDGNWVLNEIPDYGEQLVRCQRYFCRFNFGRNDLFFGALSTNLDKAWITIPTPVVMRTAPSASFSTTFNAVIRGNGFQLEVLSSNSTVTADTSTTRCCNILITPNEKPSDWTAQQVVMIYTSSSWYMDCSADL